MSEGSPPPPPPRDEATLRLSAVLPGLLSSHCPKAPSLAPLTERQGKVLERLSGMSTGLRPRSKVEEILIWSENTAAYRDKLRVLQIEMERLSLLSKDLKGRSIRLREAKEREALRRELRREEEENLLAPREKPQ